MRSNSPTPLNTQKAFSVGWGCKPVFQYLPILRKPHRVRRQLCCFTSATSTLRARLR
jgi:hypothetical protein